MSARRKKIESLLYWPKELRAIIASYAELEQCDRIDILLYGPHGTRAIVVMPDMISIFWITPRRRRIFLRCGGIQSREVTMYEILQMVDHPEFMPSRNLQKFFRAYADTVIGNCYSIQSKFCSAFTQKLAEIE
jgi:hypothetical protein